MHAKTSWLLIPEPKHIKINREKLPFRLPVDIMLSRQCDNHKSRLQLETIIHTHFPVPFSLCSENDRLNDNTWHLLLDHFPLSARQIARYQLEPEDLRVLKRSFGQGYVIKTQRNKKRVLMIGAGDAGLLYALMTFKQLLSRGPDHTCKIPEIRVRDFPDFEYRAYDWLLNAEANRWCYDFGDGAEQCIKRIKRQLDRALAYKINMIHFDGLGWDVNRFPGYTAIMRELNAYARARGIALIFGGYGGGYGATYQLQFEKQGRYWGKAFRNRRSYPAGRIYKCMGVNCYPEKTSQYSRTVGTCVSNAALRALKIKEITRFVKHVEPGALYIHDLDTGDYHSQAMTWQMRCNQCRKKWPSDRLEEKNGAAGAYADWFTQLRKAISGIENKSGYRGKDCLTIFTGPLYTMVYDHNYIWEKELTYFKNLSARMPPGHNIEFGIREQVLASKGEYRTVQLSKVLAPRKHGVFTLCFAGSNLFDNDHLFSALPTVAHVFNGSRMINLEHGHVHQEPLQVFDAIRFWNSIPRGITTGRKSNTDVTMLDKFKFNYKISDFPDIYSTNGILGKICRHLYGNNAARHMAALYSLMSPGGYGPAAIIWYPITRRLWNGDQLFDAKWHSEWKERWAVNQQAMSLVTQSLKQMDKAHHLKANVVWLKQCLVVATELLRILVKYNYASMPVSHKTQQGLIRDLDELRKDTRKNVKFDFVDPLGGDVGTWLPAIHLLKKQYISGVG